MKRGGLRPGSGRPKGSKTWKTIAKEKAREFYLNELAKNIAELSHIHIEAAKAPENTNERQYALNQLIGKPVEKVEVEQTTTLKVDV